MPRRMLKALALAAAAGVTGGIVGTGIAQAAKPASAASIEAFVAPLIAAHDATRAGSVPPAPGHCSQIAKRGDPPMARRPILLLQAGLATVAFAGAAAAAAPQQLVADYAVQAKKENPSYREFSAARGAELYRLQRARADGTAASCSACHTADPRAPGKSRAGKEIAPLAPAANPSRFTDTAQVEKWFARNCPDVLDRACTAQEKGDFITYLLSVR